MFLFQLHLWWLAVNLLVSWIGICVSRYLVVCVFSFGQVLLDLIVEQGLVVLLHVNSYLILLLEEFLLRSCTLRSLKLAIVRHELMLLPLLLP